MSHDTKLDHFEHISKHFTYHECLWLPTWGRHATEEDGLTTEVLLNLTAGAAAMDAVRDFFDLPINVHVWYRPVKYNAEVGGSATSAHMCLNPGIWACDFDVVGMDCDAARAKILIPDADGHTLLDRLNLRMEDNGPGAEWIHLDSKRPISGRVFKC